MTKSNPENVKKSVVGVLLFAAFLFLLLVIEYAAKSDLAHPVDRALCNYIPVGIPVLPLLGVGTTILVLRRRIKKPELVRRLDLTMGIVFAIYLGVSLVKDGPELVAKVNRYFETGVSNAHEGRILSIYRNSRSQNVVKLTDWRVEGGVVCVRMPDKQVRLQDNKFRDIAIGDRVELSTKTGWLGIEWVYEFGRVFESESNH